MAKLTIEEAKLKLAPIEKAIEGLKSMGLEIPASLQQEADRLLKIVSGNSSVNVAATFNEKLATQINAHPEFVELIASQVGTRARLTVVVNTDAEGKKTISFEGGGSTGGGGKSGTSTGGGTKASTPYNHYVVSVIGDLPEYAEKTGTFETAAKTIAFILNGGKNPLSLGAEWQKGNSMVRALEALQKNEAFAKNFSVDKSYVQVEKKAAEPVATEPAQ